MCFGVRRSISLYKPLITLAQAIIVFGSLIPTKAVFNSGFKDFTKQLIKADSFYLVFLVYQ